MFYGNRANNCERVVIKPSLHVVDELNPSMPLRLPGVYDDAMRRPLDCRDAQQYNLNCSPQSM